MSGCYSCYLQSSSFKTTRATSKRSLSLLTVEIIPGYILHPHGTPKVKHSKQGSKVQSTSELHVQEVHKHFPSLLNLLPWTITLSSTPKLKNKTDSVSWRLIVCGCVWVPAMLLSRGADQALSHPSKLSNISLKIIELLFVSRSLGFPVNFFPTQDTFF